MIYSRIGYHCYVNKKQDNHKINKISEFLFGWQTKYDEIVGYRASQKECATWMGISEQTFSHLKNGLRKKADLDTVMSIYNATRDPQIFAITGYDKFAPKSPSSTELTGILLSLPPEELSKLMEAFNLAVSAMKETGIEIDSPEGVEILNSALREKGLK